jgi:hypothetical protein
MLYPPVRGQERHGRPFLVDSIVMETPEAEFWHEQYGVRAVDQPRQFDVAMTHELFHAVGVEHHGEYDYAQILDARAVGDPLNATPHAGWFEHRRQEPVYRLFDERSSRDISQEWANAALAYVNSRLPSIVAENPSLGFHTKDGVNSTVQLLHVGRPHGEHSGDASCIMRYWLADAYVKRGEPNAYYIIPDGTEPVGSKICRSTDGTSINQAGRLPQSRYFDANPSRGRCSDWICINDAVAPKSASIPYTPPSP